MAKHNVEPKALLERIHKEINDIHNDAQKEIHKLETTQLQLKSKQKKLNNFDLDKLSKAKQLLRAASSALTLVEDAQGRFMTFLSAVQKHKKSNLPAGVVLGSEESGSLSAAIEFVRKAVLDITLQPRLGANIISELNNFEKTITNLSKARDPKNSLDNRAAIIKQVKDAAGNKRLKRQPLDKKSLKDSGKEDHDAKTAASAASAAASASGSGGHPTIASQNEAKRLKDLSFKQDMNRKALQRMQEREQERKRQQASQEKALAEAKAKEENDARRKAEEDARQKAATDDARAKAEADAKAKTEADARAKAETVARAKAEEDAKARTRAEENAKAEARANAERDKKDKNTADKERALMEELAKERAKTKELSKNLEKMEAREKELSSGRTSMEKDMQNQIDRIARLLGDRDAVIFDLRAQLTALNQKLKLGQRKREGGQKDESSKDTKHTAENQLNKELDKMRKLFDAQKKELELLNQSQKKNQTQINEKNQSLDSREKELNDLKIKNEKLSAQLKDNASEMEKILKQNERDKQSMSDEHERNFRLNIKQMKDEYDKFKFKIDREAKALHEKELNEKDNHFKKIETDLQKKLKDAQENHKNIQKQMEQQERDRKAQENKHNEETRVSNQKMQEQLSTKMSELEKRLNQSFEKRITALEEKHQQELNKVTRKQDALQKENNQLRQDNARLELELADVNSISESANRTSRQFQDEQNRLNSRLKEYENEREVLVGKEQEFARYTNVWEKERKQWMAEREEYAKIQQDNLRLKAQLQKLESELESYKKSAARALQAKTISGGKPDPRDAEIKRLQERDKTISLQNQKILEENQRLRKDNESLNTRTSTFTVTTSDHESLRVENENLRTNFNRVSTELAAAREAAITADRARQELKAQLDAERLAKEKAIQAMQDAVNGKREVEQRENKLRIDLDLSLKEREQSQKLLRNAEHQIAEQKRLAELAQEEIAAVRAEMHSLSEAYSLLEDELVIITKQRDAYSHQLSENQAIMDQLNSDMNRLKAELAQVRNAYQDLRIQYQNVINERNDALLNIKLITADRDRLKGENQELRRELEGLRKELFDVKKDRTALYQELQQAKIDRDAAIKRENTLKLALDRMTRERDDAIRERDVLRAAAARLPVVTPIIAPPTPAAAGIDPKVLADLQARYDELAAQQKAMQDARVLADRRAKAAEDARLAAVIEANNQRAAATAAANQRDVERRGRLEAENMRDKYKEQIQAGHSGKPSYR